MLYKIFPGLIVDTDSIIWADWRHGVGGRIYAKYNDSTIMSPMIRITEKIVVTLSKIPSRDFTVIHCPNVSILIIDTKFVRRINRGKDGSTGLTIEYKPHEYHSFGVYHSYDLVAEACTKIE